MYPCRPAQDQGARSSLDPTAKQGIELAGMGFQGLAFKLDFVLG